MIRSAVVVAPVIAAAAAAATLARTEGGEWLDNVSSRRFRR